MDRLKRVLLKIQELDLAGRIEGVEEVVKGFGGSCEVYRGKCTILQKLVAIKRFRLFLQKEQKFAEKLTVEIYIWSKLEHPNVLPFLGFYLEESGFPNLVSEWMDNGTLFDYLPKLPRGIAALNMVIGIAEGLSYLHSMKVIHADLKSSNVLISQEGTPLLADFGVSSTLSSTLTMVGTTTCSPRGTARWMAIELLNLASGTETPSHSVQADVWAFGMVTYEILARQIPFSHLKSDLHVMLAITKGELPARPAAIDDDDVSNVEDGLWQMCERCWKSEPNARPSIDHLSVNLRTALEHFDGLATNADQQPLPRHASAAERALSSVEYTSQHTISTHVSGSSLQRSHVPQPRPYGQPPSPQMAIPALRMDSRGRSYRLEVTQHPKRAVEFGFDNLSGRTLAPPPIAQLIIRDFNIPVNLDAELPFLVAHLFLCAEDGTPLDADAPDTPQAQRPIYGTLVSSAQTSRNPQGTVEAYFIFTNVNVRQRGLYKLRIDLMRTPFNASSAVCNPGAPIIPLYSAWTNTFSVVLSNEDIVPMHEDETGRISSRLGDPPPAALNWSSLERVVRFPVKDTKHANFVCPVPGCGSTFTRHFNLKGHLRSHCEGEPYKCKWIGCNKGFAHLRDCKRHEQLHLNTARPYVCKGCQRAFARMDMLNQHLKSNAGKGCQARQKYSIPDQLSLGNAPNNDNFLSPYPSSMPLSWPSLVTDIRRGNEDGLTADDALPVRVSSYGISPVTWISAPPTTPVGDALVPMVGNVYGPTLPPIASILNPPAPANPSVFSTVAFSDDRLPEGFVPLPSGVPFTSEEEYTRENWNTGGMGLS